MPARKSNASVASAPVAAEKTDDAGEGQNGLSIDDLTLPRSMVQRLAKGVLPANTQIQKDALLALHRSATVFVSYLASHANENTMRTGKKTIQPSDVFEALREVEFENFLPRLEKEHQKFTSIQTDKRNSYRKKVKEEKLAAAAKFAHENTGGTQDAASSPSRSKGVAGDGSPDSATAGASRLDDSPPAAKKARRDGEEMDVEDDDEDANLADDNVDDEEEEEEDEEEVEDEEESGEEGASGEEDEDDEERDKDDLVEDPIESVDKKHEEESSDGDESD